MKKNIVLYVSLWVVWVSVFSQVSINTQNPKGIFYIDAAADNTGSSTDRYNNDVMIDTNGSLIIGVDSTTPTGKAKVDITSVERYGALRFQDGNEAEGMVLFGDKDGYASWGMMKGSGGYMESVVAPTGIMASRTNYPLWFTLYRNYIPILDDGNYVIMIRTAMTYTGTPVRMSGYFYLCKNDADPDTSVIDTYEFYINVIDNQKFSAYTILRAIDVKADDKLYIVARPQSVNISWNMDLAATQVFVYRV
ncbi:hypothetical protein [Dysgonomonas macrotermitis]|uniref:C1q domain-containing protein n=1 Tax=Dysgonomonas macrotermitis TaxID=1346286 RepID=A0A1M4WFQ1_9BACT|nr:hypothetical protein [Dysgonomonas macrotermitis]SHE79782.1 hypothetical protein SAMN05444362_102210 [Dysgonomonas macrotermitis]